LDPASEDAVTVTCTIMIPNKQVKLAAIQDFNLNFAEELKESTQNLYCHYLLPHITFQMAMTASFDY